MKAVVIGQPGRGLEAWQLVEREAPRPGPGQIQIRVRAASLNYRDLLVAQGKYGRPSEHPLVPLADGAGEVSALGEGVTQWRVGDRVATAYFPTWLGGSLRDEDRVQSGGSYDADGVLAEHVVWPATGVVRIPASLSFEEAATLPCAAVTAWSTLFEPHPRSSPGATIVTQGTGGVSLFVVQLALAAGLRVIATSSSEAKIEKLRALGVHETINYAEHPAWHERVLALTDGQGADHVVDVGGALTLPSSFAATRSGGLVSVLGMLGGFDQRIDPLPILFRNLEVRGLSVGSVPAFEALVRTLATQRIAPIIDEVFPLSRAHDALRKLEGASHFGKLVIAL